MVPIRADEDGSRGAGPREERRRQQAALSTAHLLDAAEHVFADQGYSGTTVRSIAERAELSVGALYKLFPGGKEEVIAAVIARRTEEFLAAFDGRVAGGGSPVERLHELIDVVARYFSDNETFYRLFQRAIGGDWLKFEATATDQNWRSYQTVLDRWADVLAEGRDAGVFVDDDPAAMAVMLSGLLQAYLAHVVVGLGPLRTPLEASFSLDRLHALVDRAFVVGQRA